MASDTLAVAFLVFGAIACIIGVVLLTGAHRVGTRDGLSEEKGYHTPKPRWGFLVLGILLLLLGCLMRLN